MNIKEIIVSGIVLLFLVAGGVYLGNSFKESKVNPMRLGSVAISNEYIATTTKDVAGNTLTDRTLKTTGGVIGQVTVTGAAAGQITLCNATTSDVTQRSAALATTSLRCINIPASTAAGTYTFDAIFDTGIILDTDAVAPTSTVMYR